MTRIQQLINANGKWIGEALAIISMEPLAVQMSIIDANLYEIEQWIIERRNELIEECLKLLENVYLQAYSRETGEVIPPEDFVEFYLILPYSYRKLLSILRKKSIATAELEQIYLILQAQVNFGFQEK